MALPARTTSMSRSTPRWAPLCVASSASASTNRAQSRTSRRTWATRHQTARSHDRQCPQAHQCPLLHPRQLPLRHQLARRRQCRQWRRLARHLPHHQQPPLALRPRRRQTCRQRPLQQRQRENLLTHPLARASTRHQRRALPLRSLSCHPWRPHRQHRPPRPQRRPPRPSPHRLQVTPRCQSRLLVLRCQVNAHANCRGLRLAVQHAHIAWYANSCCHVKMLQCRVDRIMHVCRPHSVPCCQHWRELHSGFCTGHGLPPRVQ